MLGGRKCCVCCPSSTSLPCVRLSLIRLSLSMSSKLIFLLVVSSAMMVCATSSTQNMIF